MVDNFREFINKRSIKRFFLCGLLFFFVTMPFRRLFSVLSITEVRPAGALPPVFGMLFGMPGALGAAVGNLAADICSGYTPAVYTMGFAAQFLYGYLAYKLWHTQMVSKEDNRPNVTSLKNIMKYLCIIFADSAAITGMLAGILQINGYGDVDDPSTSLLFLNNFNFSILIGIPILMVCYAKKIDFQLPVYRDSQNGNAASKGNKFDAAFVSGLLLFLGWMLYHILVAPPGETAVKIIIFIMYVLFCIYALKPCEKYSHNGKKSSEKIKMSITAKFTGGMLLFSLLAAVICGILEYKNVRQQNLSMLEQWNDIYFAISGSLTIIFLFLLLLIGYVEKRITVPIAILAAVAESFAKSSHSREEDQKLEDACQKIKSSDEIGMLADDMRFMMSEVISYANHLSVVMAEKERIGAELEIACRIQADMLPGIFPAFPANKEFDLHAAMYPAKEVGGDFYDFYMLDQDHLAVVIADVSGKGVPAALFMVITKTLIKNCAQQMRPPKEIFECVNDQLCEGNEEGFFVTAWMGILTISTGNVTYVNAGHNPPMIGREGEGFEILGTAPGFVLAFMGGIRYQQAEFKMEPGDILFLYTDGVTEAMNQEKEFFEEKRLLESLAIQVSNTTDVALGKLLANVRNRVDEFSHGQMQADDITMLALEYKGITEG